MLKIFSQSAKSLKKTRILCASAVLAALFIALYALKLQLTPQLRITFTFIPLAVAGWLFGPVPAMLVGAVGDIVGALLFPQGAYFPGFTLTAMLSGLVFGLFLYDGDSSKHIVRISLSKFMVSILMNVLLNSLWLSIITSKGYIFHLAQHFIKNILVLPVEIILLVVVLKFLSKHGIKNMYK